MVSAELGQAAEGGLGLKLIDDLGWVKGGLARASTWGIGITQRIRDFYGELWEKKGRGIALC